MSLKSAMRPFLSSLNSPEVPHSGTNSSRSSLRPEPKSASENSRVKYRPAPSSDKNIGRLDMVIAFDTTGSMSCYIDSVRRQVADLIPELFRDNKDLRLSIVAFGDYCDMRSRDRFGNAYQRIPLTDDQRALIDFVHESKNTSGGDGDEFYELVIKKIVEETKWRRGSTRSILLIADAEPHEIGYSYEDFIINNQIDWRTEAKKATRRRIRIDTVTIHPLPWFKELSNLTNGICVPFSSSEKTSDLVRASANARGSREAREKFDRQYNECKDEEIRRVYEAYQKERNNL